MSQQRKPTPNSKLWALVGLMVAGLILVLNGWLSQQGEPLPAVLTDYAEDVVATSVVALDISEETPFLPEPSPTAEPVVERPAGTLSPTPLPYPDSLENANSAPWLDAEITFDYYVVALSWQPAFCETHPHKEECVTQSAQRYDAHNFALHGLWPSDFEHSLDYCDVSPTIVAQDRAGDWCDLPALTLSDDVWSDLASFMPGTASCLQNHEWYKHGTCAGMSAEAYFALSNHLTGLFSQTAFDDYVADHAGEWVQRNALLDQFAREFGADTQDYLSLRCDQVEAAILLTEIQLVLRPDIAPEAAFGELFPTDDIRPRGTCPTEFKIDVVGLGNF